MLIFKTWKPFRFSWRSVRALFLLIQLYRTRPSCSARVRPPCACGQLQSAVDHCIFPQAPPLTRDNQLPSWFLLHFTVFVLSTSVNLLHIKMVVTILTWHRTPKKVQVEHSWGCIYLQPQMLLFLLVLPNTTKYMLLKMAVHSSHNHNHP